MIKILAIDDDKHSLIIQQVYVKHAFPDAVFITAPSGKEGLLLAEKYDPDVILLDIMMPESNGFEVCQELKNSETTKNIPVLFITAAKGDKDLEMKAIKAGGEGFLLKPFEEIQFMAQIKTMAKLKKIYTPHFSPPIPALSCNILNAEHGEHHKEVNFLQKVQHSTAVTCSRLTFTTPTNLEHNLRESLFQAAQIAQAKAVSIYLTSENRVGNRSYRWHHTKHVSATNSSDLLLTKDLWPVNRLLNNQVIIINDLQDVPSAHGMEKAFWDSRSGMMPMLAVPLIYQETYLGYLELISAQAASDQSVVECLKVLANAISGAIESVAYQNQLMKAAEKANESSLLKSAHMASMSHEIRTPMNGLIGFLDLLGQQDLSEEEKLLYMSMIRKSSNRLLTTISSIIEISKIESGQAPVEWAEENVGEIMHLIQQIHVREAAEQEHQVYFRQKSSSKRLSIITDKSKLITVLHNLINLAVYHAEKGTLEFDYVVSGNKITFGIRGAFDRPVPEISVFSRFDKPYKDNYQPNHEMEPEMAITRAYADMLKGEIWIAAEKKKQKQICFSIDCQINHDKNDKK